MTKYSEIEVQTAKSLLEDGYRWITRERSGKIWTYKNKPHRNTTDQLYQAWDYNGDYFQICTKQVPIFLNVTCMDKEPVSLENIVHPQILDDVEHRYLSAFIKPFRKRVKYISKEEDFDCPFDGPGEFIHIELSDGDIADFPDFKANTMYKGMKLGYEYSIEELGL